MDKAVNAFKRQSEITELADNHYYLAKAYLELGDLLAYESALNESKALYLENRIMNDPYSTPMDKVFLEDIKSELVKVLNKG